MSVPVPSVTLSMFWPLLLHAAGSEYNPNMHRALESLETERGPDAELFREDVAEEMAREHFPSGAVGLASWNGSDRTGAWYVDSGLYDTFLEVASEIEERTDAELSHTDPAHVAMVIRMLAISQGMGVGIDPPSVQIKHDQFMPDDNGDPTEVKGYLIRCVRTAGRGGPLSAGLYLPYQPGESAETLDVGAAVFRWMAERHAEIVAHLEVQEEAETSAGDSVDPDVATTRH